MSKKALGILSNYQKKFDAFWEQNNSFSSGFLELEKACLYALSSGGKRFRPTLVYMIAHALGDRADVSEVALAIEYFHTASLIADDLPCMDNDDERRKKPSVHKVFGEATALLASYALIAAGYGAIGKCAEKSCFGKELCVPALENVAYNTGVFGATGGQFIDLNPQKISLSTINEIIHKKTVSLFEISFVLGWLFGGGSQEQLPLVKKAASHFGIAFQIVDDIDDMEQDIRNNCQINIAIFLGLDAVLALLAKELHSFYAVMHELNVNSEEFLALGEMLEEKVGQKPHPDTV